MTTPPPRRRSGPPKTRSKIRGGSGSNPLADDADLAPPVSPLKDIPYQREPTPAELASRGIAAALTPGVLTMSVLAEAMPMPHEPLSSEPTLISAEREELQRCEQGLALADTAFWVQGRLLQVIRDGDLYRDEFDSFETYCLQTWGITKRRANQLIAAWRLAEQVVTGFEAPPRINEGQIRALLPYADAHADSAAVHVYTLIHGIKDGRVTAEAITDAIRVLPADRYDPGEVASILADHFAQPVTVIPPQRDEDTTEVAFTKFHDAIRSITRFVGDAHDKDTATRVADELEQAAAQIRAQYS